MTLTQHPHRRQVLLQSGLLAAGALLATTSSSWAQSEKKASTARPVVIAQIVDASPAQQDVSKDFLIGARAAWQDINLKGGIRGRKVFHLALETDGSAGSVKQALDTAVDHVDCVAISGSAGHRVAAQLLDASRAGSANLAHVAPWLQGANTKLDDKTFAIFTPREAQIAYAIKTLSVMGLKELGAVYGSAQDFNAYHHDIEQIAATLQLRLYPFQAGAGLRQLGEKMTASTPGVLLFLGGTPELADFTQGLEQQGRQRYVVAMSDVNLQTLKDMGAARGTPIIATQPVPLATAALPLVRGYRETLARLFDEPPTALSLAGFIAARFTYEVLNSVDAPLTRYNALAAFQKRSAYDLGGFQVNFDAQGRNCNFVTQSMLGRDGRLIG